MLYILSVFIFFKILPFANDDPKELKVVPDVDLEKYSGTWYEIARLPNKFQNRCAGKVTATYKLLEDGKISVINRCVTNDGESIEAEGIAKLAEQKGSNAKLKVRFAPAILSFLPFVWGDYWIIELAPDYSYAVIGEPKRRYLWILSRTPQMDSSVYNELLQKIKSHGYDITRLVKTAK